MLLHDAHSPCYTVVQEAAMERQTGSNRLHEFFLSVTRRSFAELGVGDEAVVDYVAALMTEFARADRLYALTILKRHNPSVFHAHFAHVLFKLVSIPIITKNTDGKSLFSFISCLTTKIGIIIKVFCKVFILKRTDLDFENNSLREIHWVHHWCRWIFF